MTSLRFVLRAVGICARVAAGARGLAAMPAVPKRSRRLLVRAVTICASVAAVASLVVAPPAAPARAAPASRAALAAQLAGALSALPSARGRVSVTYPGGDFLTSITDDGEDPALIDSFFTTAWPQQVGLPAGTDLSDLIQATYNMTSSWVNNEIQPPPPTFSGASYSVSGSTITIDIPAADIQGQTDSWLIGMAAAIAGVFAYVATWAACIIFFIAPVPLWGSLVCSFVGTFFWTLAAYAVGQRLTGSPFDSQFWKKALTASLVAAAGFAAFGFFAPWLLRVLPGLAKAFGQKLAQWAKSFLGFLGNKLADLIDWLISFFESGAAETAADIELTAQSIGAPAEVADGTVTNGALGLCMDAYGSNGGAPDNQLVAVNVCNGNPAQDWSVYSNNTVSVWGRCLSIVGSGTTGGPAAPGLPVVLYYCQGVPGQEWVQAGDTLVNPASGLCLDDPDFSTMPGTSLQVETCNGSSAQQWSLPTGNPQPSGSSCDLYAYYGTPCVAAYSMVRALYSNYSGPLYQVQRASDGATADIGLQSSGGYVNASAQDSFCGGTTCTVTALYDQSPEGNNLTITAGDSGANAEALPITIHGNEAYGLDIEPGTGYRDNSTRGVATNGAPEGMYMVASGTHVNSGCCFDFGNMETPPADNGAGHMDAVNLTTACLFPPCTGSGPWVQADMENGQYMGDGSNPGNLGNSTSFVTALLKNDGQANFALKGGDATGGGLSTWWDGSLPSGYAPMHQEGGIGLGTGGDNSRNGVGSFFEGVMTAGEPPDIADDAVQANIVAVGYAGNTNPTGPTNTLPPAPNNSTEDLTPSAAGQAVVHSAGGTGCGAAGFSSVYTVDNSTGHLDETYLPCMFQNWNTQDLSAEFGTPAVMAGTEPVSIVHCGWTSVYTIDTNGDLQETYLSAIGNGWGTQDLSMNYGTPPTNVTPTAVEHTQGASGSSPGCGFTSVYMVDVGSGDLQETYLPNSGFPGDPWTTQDLSKNYGVPPVAGGTSPVAVVHCGWTSVYYVNTANGLEEAYLPEITYPWSFQSLSSNYGTPAVAGGTSPTAVVHSAGDTGGACGWTSVYTVDAGPGNGGDLEETYLPDEGFPGDNWGVQDLTQHYGVPQVAAGTSPVALVHMGFTSVYYLNTVPDLEEAYLPAIYGPWSYQDLSGNYGSPSPDRTPIVLVHPDVDGNLDWTSVYTMVNGGDLEETYLSNVGFPGDPWQTQDLSQRFGTPKAT